MVHHRKALHTACVAALAAPVTLTGVAASAADERTTSGLAPPATTGVALATDDHRPDPTGGIDGGALRHRMLHEEPGKDAPGLRAAQDAPRVQEKESSASGDDGAEAAQRLPAPEARAHRGWELRVDGGLSTAPIAMKAIAASDEDDGAIPLARDLRLGKARPGVTTTGTIGDGPHGSDGSATGDYDFYRFDASRGETLTVDIDPGGDLAPNALLYDADGHLVVGAQDQTGDGNVHLSHRLEARGTYYVAVGNHYPGDPFDPASGLGVVTEGPYELDVSLHARGKADTDVFAVPLRKGDVLGATVTGSARQVALYDLRGDLVQSSAADVGVIYPEGSPLARGGNATANHVVQRSGLYLLTVADGSGDYSVTVGAHRAPSTRGEPPQTVLLDFSGPTFDNRVFGAAVVEPGVRDTSPMRAFLPRWGLEVADEQAVVEATTARVREMLREEIPGSRVRVTNDLEDPDLFGEPGVSRVVVGGTVAESGLIPAFGMAQSIDPGNFAREETAIVMPELMSGEENPAALNHALTDESDRVRAVSQSLGNVAGHEIGHLLGSLHTDDHDEHTGVMNTGNLLHFYAIGPDDVAGTADDDHVAMRNSRYDPLQGISGVEDTRGRTAVALR